ncbi:fimbrial protein [Burkholderia plantarii]|nr:fimbrial protein [Burkholderia plantarii]ALK34644.1 fimbrial protein [Burkholderia plantarii]GLZ22364.1 fimbrial protein [Burkholderia plantarii]
MGKIAKIVTSLVAVSSVGVVGPAFAADGTIMFTGKVNAQTCTINGGGSSSKDFTVALPNVSASQLAAAGATAGRTGFSIALTNCTPATGNVHTFFEAGPTIDPSTGNLVLVKGDQPDATDVADNVQISLLNGDQTKIQLGAPDASQNSKSVPIDKSGAATLSYFAEYVATGTASGGSANSSVMYSIAYQ